MADPATGWVEVSRHKLPSGALAVTVSLAPGKRVTVTLPANRATNDNIAAAVTAAVATGRFDGPPPRTFQ